MIKTFILTGIGIALLTASGIDAFAGTLGQISQPRQLSLGDRLSYQRAIEEVYWRHRIWESPDPKPSLDQVISAAQLQKKVEDYLRNSLALEDYWQQPLSPQQLQAEMDRMGQHTKQPDLLRELFDALGNDPFVIAECLARPALSERLITNWYAHDERFHGELKRRAEGELRAHHSIEEMQQGSGEYKEIEWVRSNPVDPATKVVDRAIALSDTELKDKVENLVAVFATAQPNRLRSGVAVNESLADLPSGVLSSLQEDEGRYYAMAVLKTAHDRVKLATVEWHKEPLEFWRSRAEPQIREVASVMNTNYTVPPISAANGCIDNTWTPTDSAPEGRESHTAVWTGSEMIIWGGSPGINSGGKYNPSTDTWTATSLRNAPAARYFHTAVWTGTEMLVWGGRTPLAKDLKTGARYNPSTDRWTPISTTNAPHGREAHTAIWTGSEMVVWGGFYYGTGVNTIQLNTGAKYNPSANTWIATSIANVPAARSRHTAVWTGSEMIVWGGGFDFNTGGRYNPGSDTWTSTSTTSVPAGRSGHSAIWTGKQMIVWGGANSDDFGAHDLNTGGRYNPVTNSWAPTSVTNAPIARSGQTAVWTGSKMVVWGGQVIPTTYLNSGGIYNPGTNTWAATNLTNAASVRSAHTAIWTGTQMIVWGGYALDRGNCDDGSRYDPETNVWAPIGTPAGRSSHTAIWIGTEMIIWGGGFNSDSFGTGSRYNPSTDTWTATAMTGAPTARRGHTAVWSGSEMIIWGGFYFDGANFVNLNTGGKYNPASNSWTPTSNSNAPTGRGGHVALWTASEMIIWGGSDGFNTFNDGKRYNPSSDTWRGISTVNAPLARSSFTGIWTGNRMIIWGGSYYDPSSGYHNLNTGGSYNPTANAWTATGTANAPTARNSHTAVWSGSEMIVWGGLEGYSTYSNTGARYSPATNTWAGVNTANTPTGRYGHSAVWTGSEMIVWGGNYSDDFGSYDLNTGGRYDPVTNSWAPTSVTNAPTARSGQPAVWTGEQMIIWGGGFGLNTGGRYCAQPPN